MTTAFASMTIPRELAASRAAENEKDIETLIKAEVFKNQVRLKEFFQDYDKLRKGRVIEEKVDFKFLKGLIGGKYQQSTVSFWTGLFENALDRSCHSGTSEALQGRRWPHKICRVRGKG
jgi:hypothetical protein